jgi:GNAT superfamily N-acetyltransferase
MLIVRQDVEYQSLSRVAEMDGCRNAGETLARAFETDPVISYALPRLALRVRVLPLLYEKLARVATTLGGLEILPGNAAALWLESRMEAPFVLSLRLGFLRVLWLMGPVALLRLMRHESFCASRARRLGLRNFGYLWVIGVAPVVQKQGRGRFALDRSLEKLQRRGHSVCLLKTETEGSVEFYRKAGFSCLETQVVPSSGIRYWLLQKELSPTSDRRDEG